MRAELVRRVPGPHIEAAPLARSAGCTRVEETRAMSIGHLLVVATQVKRSARSYRGIFSGERL
jgi:hypothetical protein